MVERARNIWGGYTSRGYRIAYLVFSNARTPSARVEKSAGTPPGGHGTRETIPRLLHRHEKNHGIAKVNPEARAINPRASFHRTIRLG
jgi:hypothetical protein